MIVGIGIDIVEVKRVRAALERHGERARRRLFTKRELSDCGERPDPAECLAARFAAKEAALKALGSGKAPGMRWTELETLRGPTHAAPRLELTGEAKRRAARLGMTRVWVSLSHDGGLACALVVLEAEVGPDP